MIKKYMYIIIGVIVLLGIIVYLSLGRKTTESACIGTEPGIFVAPDTRQLHICDTDGVRTYHVSLGRGGIDKRAEGDNKTPVGTYTLSAPQSSKRFGIFIPVGYPTAEQVASGYTGSAIGVHGPDRRFARLGFITKYFDWTQGCIAVSKQSEINEIADWVRDHPDATITIH